MLRDVAMVMTRLTPRALVVLRVPRASPPPDDAAVEAAITSDRAKLGLPAIAGLSYLLAGPYPIELDGRSLDEYVAWET
jgi:hypothetical protein